MRLQARLAITVALAAAIAILIMATLFSVVSARQQRQAIDNQLIEAVSEPQNLRPGGRGDGGRRANLDDFFEEGGDFDGVFTLLRVTGPQGTVLLDEGLPAVSVDDLDGPTLSTIRINGERFRMVAAPVGPERQSVLQIASSIEANEAGLAASRTQILGASVIGIALAAIMGAVVARRLTEPITSVSDAAMKMANSQQLPEPIEVTRTDEVGDLGASFNAMLAALQLSREQQKRLVADASHELRTPLTSLRLKLDLLDSTPDLDPAQRQELLATSATEVEQLGDLVTELVSLATDHTGADEALVEASLLELATSMAEQHSRRSGRQITVSNNGGGERQMLRPKMVSRGISNLLDNAVKYSPEGSAVELQVDGSKVEVRDHGEGIDPADLDHVFDRFFRSATARARPGNGIGLAIVQRVADTHGGTVWARNADDGSGAVVGFSVAPG